MSYFYLKQIYLFQSIFYRSENPT